MHGRFSEGTKAYRETLARIDAAVISIVMTGVDPAELLLKVPAAVEALCWEQEGV